jgi:hypothetical protein
MYWEDGLYHATDSPAHLRAPYLTFLRAAKALLARRIKPEATVSCTGHADLAEGGHCGAQ